MQLTIEQELKLASIPVLVDNLSREDLIIYLQELHRMDWCLRLTIQSMHNELLTHAILRL